MFLGAKIFSKKSANPQKEKDDNDDSIASDGILVDGHLDNPNSYPGVKENKQYTKLHLSNTLDLPDDFEATDEFNELLKIIDTKRNLYISGKAGTGKSTFIKYLKKSRKDKNIVVLAPTGIAALNAGGQTLHSFFHFPPRSPLSRNNVKPTLKSQQEIKNKSGAIDIIIIDEISMVSSDMLHAVDFSLRQSLNNDEFFGGKQMILIGDICQLPPVVQNGIDMYLQNKYGGIYFFDRFKNLQTFKKNFVITQLTKNFRQKTDTDNFIPLLTKIRYGKLEGSDYEMINSKVGNVSKDTIIITTTNYRANQINDAKLDELEGKVKHFKATYSDFRKWKNQKVEDLFKDFRIDDVLKLKIGAKVMILENDRSTNQKRYANGTLGVISKMDKDEITVLVIDKTTTFLCVLKRSKWEKIEYVYNKETKKLETRVIAGIEQFPIKLAWAITIHKSQGLTFDKIHIDLSSGAFAAGQVYTAFSRARKFEGITLDRALTFEDIKIDYRIIDFEKETLKLNVLSVK
jgi:ATP-dependent exoDNAse (exonuclease V) alpha subunit